LYLVKKCTGAVGPGSEYIAPGIEPPILIAIFKKRRGYQCAGTQAPDRADIAIKQKGVPFARLRTTAGTPFASKTDCHDLRGQLFIRIVADSVLLKEQLVDPVLDMEWHG
jgi:hypothetical protein